MANDVKLARTKFNKDGAPALAAALKSPPLCSGPSERFSWFGDDERLVVVAGKQEIPDRGVDLALAYGIELADRRRLDLVLPEGGTASTLQRAAWLVKEAEVNVFVHDGKAVTKAKVPSQKQSVAEVTAHQASTWDMAEEMRTASTPKYLRGASAALTELVGWLTTHPELDSGHRKGERNWMCRGQRVLSIQSGASGLRIRAGIHATDSVGWTTLPPGAVLDQRQERNLKQRVERGIAERLTSGGKYNKPDEHWFQGVLRAEPGLVGLEHPVLREVPAWRPLGHYEKWSRSFIDLVGVDGLGDIQVVETKLSTNLDELFVWQGLDYFVWALAYKNWLVQRLNTSRVVEPPTVQYVVGTNLDGSTHMSHRVPAHLSALDIPWRFRVISDWYTGSSERPRPNSVLLPAGFLPGV